MQIHHLECCYCVATILGRRPQSSYPWHCQAHQHAAEVTPPVGMVDPPLGIIATPDVPTVITKIGTG